MGEFTNRVTPNITILHNKSSCHPSANVTREIKALGFKQVAFVGGFFVGSDNNLDINTG